MFMDVKAIGLVLKGEDEEKRHYMTSAMTTSRTSNKSTSPIELKAQHPPFPKKNLPPPQGVTKKGRLVLKFAMDSKKAKVKSLLKYCLDENLF